MSRWTISKLLNAPKSENVSKKTRQPIAGVTLKRPTTSPIYQSFVIPCLITRVVSSNEDETWRTRRNPASGWFGANMRPQQLSERRQQLRWTQYFIAVSRRVDQRSWTLIKFRVWAPSGRLLMRRRRQRPGHLPAAAADTRLAATGDRALSYTPSLSVYSPVAARKRWFILAERLISGCLLAVKYSLISFIGRSGDQRRRQSCRPHCNARFPPSHIVM